MREAVHARVDAFAADRGLDAATTRRAHALADRKVDGGFGRTASWVAYTALAEVVADE